MKSLTRLALVLLVLSLAQGCVSTDTRKENPEKAAQLYADLGLEYLRQGKLELALTKLERSLELNKKLPQAHHYLAEVYKQMGDMELAEKYYNSAVRYDGHNPMLLNNFGAFLCQQSRVEESEKYFLRAAEVPANRTPELAYENIALCALQNGNKAKAEEYFRQALAVKSSLHKSLFQMAQLSYDDGAFMKARAFIERFHAIGETEQSLKLGIRIEQALGDNAAVDRYEKALSAKLSGARPEVED